MWALHLDEKWKIAKYRFSENSITEGLRILLSFMSKLLLNTNEKNRRKFHFQFFTFKSHSLSMNPYRYCPCTRKWELWHNKFNGIFHRVKVWTLRSLIITHTCIFLSAPYVNVFHKINCSTFPRMVAKMVCLKIRLPPITGKCSKRTFGDLVLHVYKLQSVT